MVAFIALSKARLSFKFIDEPIDFSKAETSFFLTIEVSELAEILRLIANMKITQISNPFMYLIEILLKLYKIKIIRTK